MAVRQPNGTYGALHWTLLPHFQQSHGNLLSTAARRGVSRGRGTIVAVASRLARILDGLEKRHGKPRVGPASDPYEMLVVATCGYPASEPACAKGFAALREHVGVAPADVLRAPKELVEAFEPRIRAHLLLKMHGQTICKRARPLCEQCPVTRDCAYFAKLPGAGPQNVPSACIP